MEIWDKELWNTEYQKMVEASSSENATQALSGLGI